MSEIVSTDVEREILYQRACGAVERALLRQMADAAVKDVAFAIASTAVTSMFGWLRVLSARQLAVLLADEANRGRICVVHEPPEYTAAEMAGEFE